jgi:hypothetical protein
MLSSAANPSNEALRGSDDRVGLADNASTAKAARHH